ncbi:MAG: hypothetical protein RIT10_1445 [Bacteroidota bacterium]|jgi:hypothetical protein
MGQLASRQQIDQFFTPKLTFGQEKRGCQFRCMYPEA